MPIISLLNVKGGVGKTETAINLCAEIAKFGRVLLIDNDPQSNVTQILNIKAENTLYDLYSNSRVSFSSCIYQYKENYFVMPNKIQTAELSETIRSRDKESILKNKFMKYENDFDFIIIDNSPYMGLFVKNSLAMSDYYIEIIENSSSSLEGLEMVSQLVKNMQDLDLSHAKRLGILRSKFDRTTNFSKQFNTAIQDILSKYLFDTVIYESIRYKEARALHCTIHEYMDKFAEPYTRLLKEIIQRIETKY